MQLKGTVLGGNSVILALPRENFHVSLEGFEKRNYPMILLTEKLWAGAKLYLPNMGRGKYFANGSHFNAIWEHALDVPLGLCTCPDWWSIAVITIDLDLTFDPWRRALKSFFISHLFWVMPLHLPLSQSFSNSPSGQMPAGFWQYMLRGKYTLLLLLIPKGPTYFCEGSLGKSSKRRQGCFIPVLPLIRIRDAACCTKLT